MNGDLNLHSRGASGGADTEIGLFVPGTQSASDDWSSQAANGLALAAYKLNSVLEQLGAPPRGSSGNASA